MARDIILTGLQIEDFRDALTAAFPTYDNLKQMLRTKLDKKLDVLVGNGASRKVAFDLIEIAETEGWLNALLKGARDANPGNPKLLAFEQSVGIAMRDYGKEDLKKTLEARMRPWDKFVPFDEWLTRSNQVERQVCRIEFRGDPSGTGFLVAPNVVLTAYHVVEKVMTGVIKPNEVFLRFDYKKQGVKGEVATLDNKWMIDFCPHMGATPIQNMPQCTLDYALLRIQSPLHQRAFILLPENLDKLIDVYQTKAPILIVQHPEGEPMKIAISDIERLESEKDLLYNTLTLGGSSGSPCFAINWELIALHQGSEGRYNAGLPITALLKHWQQKGFDWKTFMARS